MGRKHSLHVRGKLYSIKLLLILFSIRCCSTASVDAPNIRQE